MKALALHGRLNGMLGLGHTEKARQEKAQSEERAHNFL
jgi:hypothetical protein